VDGNDESGEHIIRISDSCVEARLEKLLKKLKDADVTILQKFTLCKSKGLIVLLGNNEAENVNKSADIADIDNNLIIAPVIHLPSFEKYHASQSYCKLQKHSDWCLARVYNEIEQNKTSFKYFRNCGKHVTVFVLDSGVNCSHPQLRGRCEYGANFVDGEKHYDFNGHGTAVASLIAGSETGVAKKAKIVSVKVMNASAIGTA
ncbi:subtilisin-like serine protease precursor, partial [Leptotrombidium deliense]